MKLRLSVRTKLFAVALVAASMVLLAGGALHASNMGFKMNKVIYPLGIDPAGRNLVALPFRNPYINFQQLCDALGVDGLGGVAGQTRVEQIQAATGTPVGHFCGDAGPLALLLRVGVEVKQPKGAPQVSGILVGSHAGGAHRAGDVVGEPVSWHGSHGEGRLHAVRCCRAREGAAHRRLGRGIRHLSVR